MQPALAEPDKLIWIITMLSFPRSWVICMGSCFVAEILPRIGHNPNQCSVIILFRAMIRRQLEQPRSDLVTGTALCFCSFLVVRNLAVSQLAEFIE